MEKTIPNNWVECSLGEIITSKRGRKPVSTIEHLKDGYIPYILIDEMEGKKIRSYTNDPKVSIVSENDVLIVWDGSIGKCGSGLNGAIGSTLVAMTPLHKIPTKYIEYILKSKNSFIKQTSTGTGLQHINKDFFEICKINLPPIKELKRIVTKLDTLFAQQELIKNALSRIPALLKDLRQQVLTEAVTGKLTENWRVGKKIEKISLKYINEKLIIENKELNDDNSLSGRRLIKINPIKQVLKSDSGWDIYTIESLCIAIVDCLHETALFSENGFKIIDTNNIEPFKINESKLRFVNKENYVKWIARLKPKKGDIVFTREAAIGNVVMISENDMYCIGQRTMIFRYSKLLNSKFCEIFMNSENFKKQYKPLIKGVASQHVNIRDLRLLEIPLPSFSEQTEIVSRVESLFTKADVIEQRYKTLKEKVDQLPQTLLHKAFKGELVEQLPTDGDAKDLLKEILELKKEAVEKKKVVRNYQENDEIFGKVAEEGNNN